MAAILTTNSNVNCGHQGIVGTSGAEKLKVQGNPVLLEEGILNKSISAACTIQTDPNTSMKKCSSVTLVNSSSGARKLKVSGKAVILSTLTGGTDGMISGTLQNSLTAAAQQQKLTTI